MTGLRHYKLDTAPPSTNGLFRNVRGRGRVKTDRYKKWRDKASWEIRLQHKGPPLDGPTALTLSMRRPRANADLDNHLKAAIDALEEGGAIANDKQISCITAAWADHEGCQITVSADVGAAA